ncbi:fimbrial protein [Photobacterium sanctipauli]|uniref:Fimbrial protein n=1 Tax=Photobacterium sanctipauli TaxID=1342794 RepID=A0A2T3NSG8_9GAMM|nr:type 4a pilus biogenesis protein PilO [Photobacterium sanctipauli]PSW19233.1 fimbrial protein [Photobacterium sanctipauli]
MTDWHELELDEMMEWPFAAQCVVAALLAAVLAVAGYWYWITPMQDELARVKLTEADLRQQLVRRANQVAALPKVRQQIEILEDRYQFVVRQLPEEEELASLLSSVNDIGVRNGLEFQRIEWASRVEHGLYFELPISIVLTGEYEDIGLFVEDIAKLSRIVTLKDIELKKPQGTEVKGQLTLRVSATTYRFKAPVKEQG